MKKNKLLSKLFVLVFVFTTIIGYNSAAYAAYDTVRSHMIGSTNAGLIGMWNGGSFSSWTQAIDSKWSQDNSAFALRAMWLLVNGSSDNEWIELGYMDGSLNNAYHHGFYTAEGKLNSDGTLAYYNEYKVTGPNTGTGTYHKYDISYYGNNTYKVLVDNVAYRTYTKAPGGKRMDVGLETNVCVSTWATQYSESHTVKDGDTWKSWPSGTITNDDDLLTGYRAAWNSYPTSLKFYKL